MCVTGGAVNNARWHRSSYSNAAGGDCVELALNLGESVPVRDSKAPAAAVVVFPAAAWAAFVDGVKRGGGAQG
jgi:hypothetical protein